MTCTLQIGDRVVLTSDGGPPEAEFALFDPGEIELQATEPGIVREIGYRTTAADAIQRLAAASLTIDVALDAAGAMIPTLAVRYARGPTVRRVAPLLGAGELFEGRTYDAELRRYEGAWLDLPALSLDVEISRATTLFQALHLVALLQEVAGHIPVVLNTREHASERRPGERSHKRIPLEHAANLPAALRTLATRSRPTPPPERGEGPDRAELLTALRAHAAASSDPQAQERFSAIESALSIREKPSRGPLADPELWALEEQLSAGNANGVLEKVEAYERRRGRHPATTYLRARASLLIGRDPPLVIAERAAALALSMTSFGELELLAAEAWVVAGQVKRAVPFARDVLDTPGTHEELRARAQQILDAADRAGQVGSIPPGKPPSMAPEGAGAPAHKSTAPARRSGPPAPDLTLDPPVGFAKAPSLPVDPLMDTVPGSPSDTEATVKVPSPSARPPRKSTHPPPQETGQSPRFTPPFPPPAGSQAPSGPKSVPASSKPSPPPLKGALSPPPRWYAPVPEAPASMKKTALGIGPEAQASSRPPRGPSAWPMSDLEERTPPPNPRQSSGRPSRPGRTNFMRGASQPPFRDDSPAAHVHIPKAPRVPVAEGLSELAERLAMPPGLSEAGLPSDAIPTSVIEARIQFTFLSRELGTEYRSKHGIELRADLAGIEAMQGELLERYPNGGVQSADEALDVRRHGALMSEILARGLGAFWVDIAPADLGYWAMVVPPNTRVWPFGRLLRFIKRAHKERDLVAYYLELQARTRSA